MEPEVKAELEVLKSKVAWLEEQVMTPGGMVVEEQDDFTARFAAYRERMHERESREREARLARKGNGR